MEEKSPMARMWDFNVEAMWLARKHGLMDLISEEMREACNEGLVSIDELLADTELRQKCEADMAAIMAKTFKGT